MPDSATAKLLEFMVPGFLHGMGNALFAIQAQAQVLSTSGEGDVAEIVTSCGNATAVLDVLRLLSATEGAEPVVPSGTALHGILDPMRVGLRDSGTTIDVDPSAFEATDVVRHGRFVRVVALAAAEIHAAVPTGCRGTMRFGWEGPRVLRVSFVVAAEQLPFEADLSLAEHSVASWLDVPGGQVARVDGGLRLTFPAVTDD